MKTSQLQLIALHIPGGNYQQMAATVRLIGQAIRAGSRYLPTRNLAARFAARAQPKDYLGQAEHIYRGFLSRWRYVKDPLTRELVTASPRASFQLVMAGDGRGVGEGLGAGDCDCATIALGSLYEAAGFPVRVVTIAGPTAPAGNLMSHVYPEILVPQIGWIAADPVLHPRGGFGDVPPQSRRVVYSVEGDVVEYSGNLISDGKGLRPIMYGDIPKIWQRPSWRTYGAAYPDYSVGFFGETNDGIPLREWSTLGLDKWGYLSPQMGVLGGGNIPVEVGPDQTLFYDGLARTPMIELAPPDYQYLRVRGIPYEGMLGLGDDGEAYVYDGLGGWFKRLFRKIKRGVKKVVKGIKKIGGKIVKGAFKIVKKVGGRIMKGIKSVVKRLPGGKALIKIAGKIKKVAMKIVRPVAKFVGKYASKIAPIAAFVPGYGPAIAAGLRLAGRVAKGITAVDRLSRGKLPWGALKSRLPIRGMLGETTAEAVAAQQDLTRLLPRYIY
jgi:hypothetical protein